MNRDLITATLIECNTWLASPENYAAPKWLRDLNIVTRNWILDIREISHE